MLHAPPGANFRMSPSGARSLSATKRLPNPSKARPRGLMRPVTKVLSTPLGVHSRIVSFPRLPSVDKEITGTVEGQADGSHIAEGAWPGENAVSACRSLPV